MPVTRTFPATVSLANLVCMANSLGAHVAAKLGHFGTDERTLTDDLCDMFYTWARIGEMRVPMSADERRLIAVLPSRQIDVEISKTTQQKESEIGADLAIRVESPLGVKRTLIQAKVFDPQDDELRCNSPAGWDKLWGQLVLMRNRSRLAHMLIYVPADRLDCSNQGIPTWEQGFEFPTQTPTSSKFGVTLIPVEDILTPSNDWKYSPPVNHTGNGQFWPTGMSLSRLILEMLLCRQGTWQPAWQVDTGKGRDNDGYPIHYTPYREISLSITNMTTDDFNDFIGEVNNALEGVELT